jgi:hypothetical protein
MKKLLFLFSFSLVFMISCEKENALHQSTLSDADFQTNPSRTISNLIDEVHPSILQSKWWNELSFQEQEFLALELAGQPQQVTNQDLQKMKQENVRSGRNTLRAITFSPGYPDPNPEGDVTLTSQTEVDDFGSMGYEHILGFLRINDLESPEKICDLSPLSDLKSVGSYCFVISITCAENLDGLHNLRTVGLIGPFGGFAVGGANLIDISALNNLKTITGSINVSSNSILESINGFSKINKIGPGQTSATIQSSYVLNITNNPRLEDMNGLSKITKVGGMLQIRFNDELRDIDDLSRLKKVGYWTGRDLSFRKARIISNPNLRNFDGLSKLKSIGGSLEIYDNVLLQDVNGLSGLSSIGENVEVIDNVNLNMCCGLYQVLSSGVPGTVDISGNGTDCNVADILADGPCS